MEAVAPDATEWQRRPIAGRKYMNYVQFRKTRICAFWRSGRCTRDSCDFAHGEEELMNTPDLSKTALCRVYRIKGVCSPDCRFAHGEQELRNAKRALKLPEEAGPPHPGASMAGSFFFGTGSGAAPPPPPAPPSPGEKERMPAECDEVLTGSSTTGALPQSFSSELDDDELNMNNCRGWAGPSQQESGAAVAHSPPIRAQAKALLGGADDALLAPMVSSSRPAGHDAFAPNPRGKRGGRGRRGGGGGGSGGTQGKPSEPRGGGSSPGNFEGSRGGGFGGGGGGGESTAGGGRRTSEDMTKAASEGFSQQANGAGGVQRMVPMYYVQVSPIMQPATPPAGWIIPPLQMPQSPLSVPAQSPLQLPAQSPLSLPAPSPLNLDSKPQVTAEMLQAAMPSYYED